MWDWITATSTLVLEKPLDAQRSPTGGNSAHCVSSAKPKTSQETPGILYKSTGVLLDIIYIKIIKRKSCGTFSPAPAHQQGHREEFGHREFKRTAADVALYPAAHICPFPDVCPLTFFGGMRKNCYSHNWEQNSNCQRINLGKALWNKSRVM